LFVSPDGQLTLPTNSYVYVPVVLPATPWLEYDPSVDVSGDVTLLPLG
jgi:hypothetical protein